jgi:hypothetical protein
MMRRPDRSRGGTLSGAVFRIIQPAERRKAMEGDFSPQQTSPNSPAASPNPA